MNYASDQQTSLADNLYEHNFLCVCRSFEDTHKSCVLQFNNIKVSVDCSVCEVLLPQCLSKVDMFRCADEYRINLYVFVITQFCNHYTFKFLKI